MNQRHTNIDKDVVFFLASWINGCSVCVLPQVWAAIPPWKQGSLTEFVVLSANEVLFCRDLIMEEYDMSDHLSELLMPM